MNTNDFYDLLTQYALDNENYIQWRKIHGESFGKLFLSAFTENDEAQIHLTAALIKISERNFGDGLKKLLQLEDFACNDFDCAALNYFIGLCYELMQNEPKMEHYYDEMQKYGIEFLYNIAFYPYYRTAKFAQREAECKKALYYYKKAIEIYSDFEKDSEKSKLLGQLYYDIGTVYLFCHNYEMAYSFLEKSYNCNQDLNPQRNYVMATLCALAGKTDEMKKLIDSMPVFLQMHCSQLVSSILNRQECHYFVVEQNRKDYAAFWKKFSENEKRLLQFIENEEEEKAEEIISEYLTDTLSFMKKQLDCRIEEKGSKILVKCKSGHTKTLCAEYEALFLMKDKSLDSWDFVAVNEFFDN